MTTILVENNIESLFKSKQKRYRLVFISLVVIASILAFFMLKFGNTNYSIDTILQVLSGRQIKGATFAIKVIRLPRMLIGVLVGFAFGVAGRTFQTMLRNPLASPDIIGVSTGTTVAAVFCILILNASSTTTSIISVISGLLVATLIYKLSGRGHFSGGRLILVGLGVQAMLRSVISFLLVRANQYDLPAAMRWLTGNLTTLKIEQVPPLLLIVVIFSSVIYIYSRQLQLLELGEASAVTIGVKTNQVRLILIISAVFLIAFATSITGPIAFIAFLSGPIAARIIGNEKTEIPAGLVGIILVLGADLIGQNLLSIKLPVGVITGILGAPYLLILLIKMQKRGGIR